MLETAAREAQNIHREATLKAKAQMDEAADKLRSIVSEYERLVCEKHKFLRRMKGNVQAELALIEDAIAEMPDVAAEKSMTRERAGDEKQQEDV